MDGLQLANASLTLPSDVATAVQCIKDLAGQGDSNLKALRDFLIAEVTHGQTMEKRELNTVLAGLPSSPHMIIIS